MARPEKVEAVADIKAHIEAARAVFLAEYAGLSVKAQQQLRRGLRRSGADFQVVKMTLARRAVAELGLEGFDDYLVGPTAIAFANSDAVSTAKVLKDFAAEHDRLVIKGGLLGMELLAPERVRQLADIEPRDVLLAKIAGAAKAPMANMAGLFSAFTRNTASVVKQLLDRRQEAEPAPVAVEPEPEAAVESEPAAVDVAVEPEVETTTAAAEPEPEAAAEPESAVVPEVDAAPEPASAVEAVPEVDAAPEPESAVEAEPEAAVEEANGTGEAEAATATAEDHDDDETAVPAEEE